MPKKQIFFMERFTFGFVLGFVPKALKYLIYGFISGLVFGIFLFYVNKSLYQSLLQSWSNRLLFGVQLLNNHYTTWFILNNLVAMITAIMGILLILLLIKRRRHMKRNRFELFEKHHPRMTLLSLYMIPIGAVFINAFFVSILLTYVYLSSGYTELLRAVLILLPNGLNEILALLFASSLGLSYLKIIEPLILKGKWERTIDVSKKLVFSKTSLYFILFIVILIVFAAYLEGSAFHLLMRH